jgi:hypothetical protein
MGSALDQNKGLCDGLTRETSSKIAEIDADSRGGKGKGGRVYLQSRLKHMRGLAVLTMSGEGVELEFGWHLSDSAVWGTPRHHWQMQTRCSHVHRPISSCSV